MDDRKQRIEALFHQAIGLQVAARTGFLERECGGDDTLRRDVEELLAIATLPAAPKRSSPVRDEVTRTEEPSGGIDPVLPEGARVGDFQIQRLLGEGTMGQVYLAQDIKLGRRVALKFIKRSVMESNGAERFLDEARATASFNHPHIVTLYAVGEHDDRPYLALEYLDGESLRVRLAAGPLPMREALHHCRALADAIAEAHERGLIHADLKPENIVIPRDGRVRIVDFGLARLARSAANAASGTPAYMAPERWRGAPPTGAIDVWAIGVMLHELITGTRPIPDGSFLQVMLASSSLQLPAVPATPWGQLVRDCLALDPAARPTADEVARRLTAMLDPRAAAQAIAPASPARPAAARAKDAQNLATELADDEIRLARGILLALVGPNGTRHRRRRRELIAGVPAAERAAVGQLIDRLLARGLVLATPDDGPGDERGDGGGDGRGDAVIEVAPEALVTAWPQLAGSLSETRPAAELAAVAAAATAEQSSQHDSDTSVSEVPPSAEVLPFEGRGEVMAALTHSSAAAIATRTPTLVTVSGDDGIGKTRLAAALHRALVQAIPGARVIAIRCQDPSVGEVDGTTRAVLRRLVPRVRRREMREQLQAQVGEAWPAVALTLGWLAPGAPELLPLAQAPGALRIATVEATGQLIRRAAEQAPLCLIVDDAHLADATTLDAIELATLDRGGAAPLWICALVGPSFDAQRPGWGERAARAEEIELEPLPDAAAAELCRTLLHPAENLPAKVIAMITARAQGNAMVLGELCRALKSEGIVRQERTGAWILETDRVNAWPHTPRLRWLAERELRRLPPDLARHAQLAAVLGPKFTVADMIGVLKVLEAAASPHRFPLPPVDALAQLDKAQILSVRRDCEFRNPMLCEAVRSSIPAPLRAELHRAAFEHYRDLRGVREERRRPRIAFHAAEAGLREPAARAYEALAAEYQYRHRYVEAEGAFSRMLALVDTAPLRLTAHHGRGLARYRTGRYEDALDDLHQARELAAGLGDRPALLTILLDEAAVLDWMWSHRRSAELVEQAIALAGDTTDPVLAARIATGRARALWRLGKRIEAHASLLEAVGRAELAGPAAYESLILSLVMLGTVLCGLGELREAREVFVRALATARAQGDRLQELTVLNNRRRLWIAEQDVARAAADLHAMLDLGRTLGLVLVELVGSYNLGELLYQAGDLDTAWPHVEQAVELAARRPDLQPRPIARLLELRMLAFEGRWQEVEVLGAELAELHRSARDEGRSDAELLPGEEVLLDAVLLARTGGDEAAWADVRARSSRHAEEQTPIEVVELQALGALRAGDLAGARHALEDALALTRRIPNVMDGRLRRRLAQLDGDAAG